MHCVTVGFLFAARGEPEVAIIQSHGMLHITPKWLVRAHPIPWPPPPQQECLGVADFVRGGRARWFLEDCSGSRRSQRSTWRLEETDEAGWYR